RGVADEFVVEDGPETDHGRAIRDDRVGPVHLIQVDGIDAEPACARLCSLLDDRRQRQEREQLRGEEHVVAPAANRLAHDALRLAIGVDLGRVDEVDAEVKGAFDDRTRITTGIVVAVAPVTRAELPTAEPHDRHSGATHLNEAHAPDAAPNSIDPATADSLSRRTVSRTRSSAICCALSRCAVRYADVSPREEHSVRTFCAQALVSDRQPGAAGQGLTAKRRQVPGTPLSSCSPRSSKLMPDPATRSVRVRDTSTSFGPATADTRWPMTTPIPVSVMPFCAVFSPIAETMRAHRFGRYERWHPVRVSGLAFRDCAIWSVVHCRRRRAVVRLWALLMSAMCEKACGKFPRRSWVSASYSSARRPRSLRTRSRRSNSSVASSWRPSSASASTSQKEHGKKAPSPVGMPSRCLSERYR